MFLHTGAVSEKNDSVAECFLTLVLFQKNK
jgi:hypothetical protein